jgi:hypothetical protein
MQEAVRAGVELLVALDAVEVEAHTKIVALNKGL